MEVQSRFCTLPCAVWEWGGVSWWSCHLRGHCYILASPKLEGAAKCRLLKRLWRFCEPSFLCFFQGFIEIWAPIKGNIRVLWSDAYRLMMKLSGIFSILQSVVCVSVMKCLTFVREVFADYLQNSVRKIGKWIGNFVPHICLKHWSLWACFTLSSYLFLKTRHSIYFSFFDLWFHKRFQTEVVFLSR